MLNLLGSGSPFNFKTYRKSLEEFEKKRIEPPAPSDYILPPINKITGGGTGQVAVFLEHPPITDMASLDRHLKSIENVNDLILQNDCQGGTNDSLLDTALRLVKQSMVDHLCTVDKQLLIDRILSDRTI